MSLFKKLFCPDYRVCKKCGMLLDKDTTSCPNCKWTPFTQWHILFYFVVVFLILATSIFFAIIDSKLIGGQQFESQNTNPVKAIEQNSGGVNIRVKPMIELSGLSVEEILKLRKDAVKRTIALGDVSKYKPSEQVFLIEDGLPWIGAYEASCNGPENNSKIGEGESRESLGILNPELLYYFIIPHYNSEDRSLCSAADYLVPRRLVYYEDKNTLVAYVDYKSLFDTRGLNYNLILGDVNAHDFGYNWAYADKSYNINFKSDNNFSKQMTQTKGFWHRGYACGLQNGCNNYSPRDDSIVITPTSLPATINIKLWKKQPRSAKQKADINFMIVLE